MFAKRRISLKILAAIAVLGCSNTVLAQNYPVRPITIVVPAGPGGGTDILARSYAEALSQRLHQTVIVENKSGASGQIGTQAVARAAPDGYTILFAYSAPIYYAHHLYPKVPYNVKNDLAIISEVAESVLILVTNKDVPATNVAEFLQWARDGKGKLSYGSIGKGSASHLVSAYLNETYDLDMTHVPYKSEGPFAQDLAAGVVPWGIGTLGPQNPYIQSGKIKPLAVLANQRISALPDVPTMTEAGYPDEQFRAPTGFVFAAPIGTPQVILDLLTKETLDIAKSGPMQARFAQLGLEGAQSDAVQFHKKFETVDQVIKKMVDISGAAKD
ncbi:Bug family tripartite tricarboxylate transporter substrate binding protein [Advenella kashmirensis]|uniref:Bug family tripartite tricarboxylate transporter substrate binding protein n=1 Tax=Advenella kashmirensis TaxID=310575 RepID=UPI0004CFAE3E|nr:tripartite tricarboxylate transporter substrate binding protein [Advenella kashmirensis]